jgi:hypothetical protein
MPFDSDLRIEAILRIEIGLKQGCRRESRGGRHGPSFVGASTPLERLRSPSIA